MRIGLLTTGFPRFDGDIPGQFVLGFARSLVALGHTLDVLCPEPGDFDGPPPRFPGIDVHWVRYAPRALERTFYGAGVLDNLRRDPRAFLGLAPFVAALTRDTYVRAPRWDALVSHWALPSALVAGLVRGGRPHLAVLHSADVFLLERLPGRRALATRVAQGASAIVCASRAVRERFLALLEPVARIEVAARTHVCAMGIEASALAAGPRTGAFTLASLGRLVPIKGLAHAIHAVARLPGVELAIAGDGPGRPGLEALARARGAHVRFTGPLYGRDKQAFFARAHAFVLPSVQLASGRTEGMPTTVLEAMDHGLPVIASDTGGLADVVRDGENGLLVPPRDASALRAAILRCQDEPFRARLAAEARLSAAEFHWPALGPHFESFLISNT